MIISFNGVDGSGKTTLINALAQELSKKELSFVRFHLRPRFINFAVNQETRLKSTASPKATKKYGFALTAIKIAFFLLDYFIFYIWYIIFGQKKIIIFDRCFYDLELFTERFGVKNIPSVAVLFNFVKIDVDVYISGDPFKINDRKNELSIEEIKTYQKRYSKFFMKRRSICMVELGAHDAIESNVNILCNAIQAKMNKM